MDISVRRHAFLELGKVLEKLTKHCKENTSLPDSLRSKNEAFNRTINQSKTTNLWFSEESIYHALDVIINDLKEENLDRCLSNLEHKQDTKIKVATLLAGNKPVYGFLEMFSVLLSGNCFVGKLIASDNMLLRFLGDLIIEIEPRFKDRIIFLDGKLEDFQAVIANDFKVSPQYLYKYFNKYPHIIHHRKYSVAIINGSEDTETLSNLAKDIFMYFGRTVYNVSKLFVPRNFDVARLFKVFEKYNYVSNFSNYMNQYEYYRSIFLLNKVQHYDNGFLLLKNSNSFDAPVGTLNFEFYDDIKGALSKVDNNFHKLEGVAGVAFEHPLRVDPGEATSKRLCKKTRFVSTINFLRNIEKIL